MEHAKWSPPIPSGAAALTAWRELDRRTRRELLRGAGPHPDPFVACIAVGYARTVLKSRMRTALRRMGQQAVIMLLVVVVGGVAAGMGGGAWLAGVIPVVVILPAMFLIIGSGLRFRLRLIRMENANAPALLAGESPVPVPPPAAPGTPLTVSFDRRRLLRLYAVQLVAMALLVLLLVGMHQGMAFDWIFMIPVAVGLAVWCVTMGYTLLRWVLPDRPVLVVEHGGLRFTAGLDVPWPAITEIRIHPVRGASRRSSRISVIAFVCADPYAVIARLQGLRRWSAGNALRYYGSPIVVTCRALDHTVEEIVAAATSFHPVRVRRFGE